jgi:hypothetical protein
MLSGFQLSRGPGGAFSSFVPLYHREMLERATSDRPLLLIPEELQETHPCFQNRVFLEPPKQLEEGTETSASCSASVEEAFENSAPQPNVLKGVPKSRSQAELLSTGSTGEPLGSWIEPELHRLQIGVTLRNQMSRAFI